MSVHCLTRVSFKGTDFVGRCIYCHKEGLAIDDRSECPKSPGWEQAVLDAIESK